MLRVLTSQEAASLLGVSRQSLYSYVSRGLLRAQDSHDVRGKRYDRHEVERLKTRAKSGRKPLEAARGSLSFGLPVLESALTLIADGELWYRGQSAAQLSTHASLEDVACLLWQCAENPFASTRKLPAVIASTPGKLPVLEQAMLAFLTLAGQLPAVPADADDISRHAHAAMLVRCMSAALLGERASSMRLHRQCAKHWQVDKVAAERIRSALVLCADHELNVSGFSARCIASSGASLHASLTGAVAALSGSRHGMASEQVEQLLDRDDDLAAWVATRAEAGTSVAGFGHRLYPYGDPRARHLLEGLQLDAVETALCKAVAHHYGLLPNVDFALVILRRKLQLPRDAAPILFCLGRSVGWLAHALEQRTQGALIRPRAHYIGVAPPTERRASKSRIIRGGKPVDK